MIFFKHYNGSLSTHIYIQEAEFKFGKYCNASQFSVYFYWWSSARIRTIASFLFLLYLYMYVVTIDKVL